MVGGADLVHFSRGGPGTRAKLWARVCQFLRSEEQRAQCLNQDVALRGTVQPGDYFAEAPVLDLGGAVGLRVNNRLLIAAPCRHGERSDC